VKRAVIYCRVSSAEQAGEAHFSLQVQEQRCRAYVEQHGWILAGMESDADSGLKTSRPGYQRLLQRARLGEIDAVVVYQASRFGRDSIEVLTRARELRELNIELVSTAEDLSSFLMLGIQAILNEEESRRLSARVGPAKRLRASQGYWLGHAPFGTVNVKGVLEPGPKFDLLRLAFRLAADGTAMREINRRINAAIAPDYIGLSTVKKMLRNQIYVGRVVWDGVDAEARWPALIDPDLFRRAGERMTLMYRQRARLSLSYPFWLVGLAYCGRCGAKMHPKIYVKTWGKRYAYVMCGAVDNVTVNRGCHQSHYQLEQIQDWTIGQLDELQQHGHDDLLGAIDRAASAASYERQLRIDALRQERSRLEGRLQAAKAAHLDAPDVFTVGDVRQVERAVRDNFAAIDRELALPAPAPGIDIADLRRFLDGREWLEARHTAPAEFRAFLQRFIDRIDVHGRGEYSISWRPALSVILDPVLLP